MMTTAAKLKSPNYCCYVLLELHICLPESPYICRKLNVNNPVSRFYNLNVPCFKVCIILLHPLKNPIFQHITQPKSPIPGHMSTDTAREISLMPSKCSAGNILRRRQAAPRKFREDQRGPWGDDGWKMVEKSLENVEKYWELGKSWEILGLDPYWEYGKWKCSCSQRNC